MKGKIEVVTAQFPSRGEALIYIVFEGDFRKDDNLKLLDKKTRGRLTEKIKTYHFEGKEGQIFSLELNDFYKEIIIVGAEKAGWKKALAEALRFAQSKKLSSVTFFYQRQLGEDFFEVGKQVAIAFYLANYYFDYYKGTEEKKKIKKIELLKFAFIPQLTGQVVTGALEKIKHGVEYGGLLTDGVYLARDLVNQPASHLHPETLVEEAFKIEKESQGKIKVEVFDEDECRRLGMGAFLGVAQGSERKPKFIILKFQNPKIKSQKEKLKIKKICLIGKSITFDSGGLSLKPSEGMETMKMDMAGGAAVLGVFKILAHLDEVGLEINKEVCGILPACENMPSGKSLKPGDVVTALNGKTIEVLNTDAEGRLTFADAISYAEKYFKPDIIIDLATLTGACMVALGQEIAGMWGNDESLLKLLTQIAAQEGEELWLMPLFKAYAKKLKSDVADIKNITGDRYGGAITAALFLAEFVKKSKWVHLDIAGPAFSTQNQGLITKGGTGWGVLTIIEFLRKYAA